MNEGTHPQPARKKGLGPLAWVAIGCAGLILLTALLVGLGGFWAFNKVKDGPAKAMAEMAIKADPNTKFISSDDESITFETKDGEVVTMNFEDIQSGKFSMTTADGETSTVSIGEGGITGTTTGADGEETDFSIFGGGGDTSNVPDEVKYPKAKSMSATMASRGKGKWQGMVNYQTGSTMQEVVEWQTGALDDCEVTRTDVFGTRNAVFECDQGSVNLAFMGQDGALQVMANYELEDR